MADISTKMIDLGLKVADTNIYEEDKIWSQYSSDKVDIGQRLTKVIRTLYKALPLTSPLRALSVGSGSEPQYKILESAFRGGLYLLDIDESSLDIINERIQRQRTDHITTILDDFNKVFLSSRNTDQLLNSCLLGKRVNLITFHHSLYYCEEERWHELFQNLYQKILAPCGAFHSVLMASESTDHYTTTWLYNHFAGKFFDHHNDQNLVTFTNELRKIPLFKKAQILSKTSRVLFSSDDFGKFMAVVWMILLYPEVHKYTLSQREEITEYVYKNFWLKKKPLIQEQNHMAIYREINFKGIL